MNLNDTNIREALLRKLGRQTRRPRAVLQELHVHNGRAIADVVTLHSEAHCYEIKGATDRIARITVQGKYYNAVFRRITLVTTECNLRRALKLGDMGDDRWRYHRPISGVVPDAPSFIVEIVFASGIPAAAKKCLPAECFC